VTTAAAQAFHRTAAYTDPARLRADYARFHRLALATGDVDPVYPVLAALARRLGLTPAERAWLVFCHVAYYHAGSGLAAFAATRTARDACMAPLNMPVGTERRAHWTRPRLAAHLAGLERAARPHGGDLHAWAAEGLPGDPVKAWPALTARLAALPGNGRWAAYKTAEMLAAVAGLDAEAPDMGHAHSTGPRAGLALLYPAAPAGHGPRAVAALDALSAQVVAGLLADGAAASMATAETTLCDFHALHAGRYYTGHDIDLMLAQLRAVRPAGGFYEAAVAARAATLPAPYLGELGGWAGPDRDRRRWYRETGHVYAREVTAGG
jgi:hypothetical protein